MRTILDSTGGGGNMFVWVCGGGLGVYYHAALALDVAFLFTSKSVWPAVDCGGQHGFQGAGGR